jgi:agmatinase
MIENPLGFLPLEGPFVNPLSFLGLPNGESAWKGARFAILPVPYDSTTSYVGGTRNGPKALLEASGYVELWDEELEQDTSQVTGFFTVPFLEPDLASPESMIRRIGDNVAAIARDGKTPVVLGGEHSITFGAVEGVARVLPEPFGVLQFDAHTDLRDSYEGTPYSHACVMRRIFERDIPIFQVGVRSISSEEIDLIRNRRIPTFPMHEIEEIGVEELIARLIHLLPERLYITIDLDCLDPSILPSTGTPEPGGFTWGPICRILRAITLSRRVVGLDMVELSPIPGLVAPDFLAAKLLYRTLGYITKSFNG